MQCKTQTQKDNNKEQWQRSRTSFSQAEKQWRFFSGLRKYFSPLELTPLEGKSRKKNITTQNTSPFATQATPQPPPSLKITKTKITITGRMCGGSFFFFFHQKEK